MEFRKIGEDVAAALNASAGFGSADGQTRSRQPRQSRSLILSAALFAILALTGCERIRLEREMNRLCEKDAGVKVYERVTLPPEDYESMKRRSEASRDEVDVFGPEYRYSSQREVILGNVEEIQKGGSALTRFTERVHRRADEDLLLENVSYLFGGGDGILFYLKGSPSSGSCPEQSKSLFEELFQKGSADGQNASVPERESSGGQSGAPSAYLASSLIAVGLSPGTYDGKRLSLEGFAVAGEAEKWLCHSQESAKILRVYECLMLENAIRVSDPESSLEAGYVAALERMPAGQLYYVELSGVFEFERAPEKRQSHRAMGRLGDVTVFLVSTPPH